MRSAHLLKIALPLAAIGGLGLVLFAQTGGPGSSPGKGASEAKPTAPPSDELRRIRENEALGMRGVVRGRVTLDDGRSPAGIRVAVRFRMHMTGAMGEGSALCDAAGDYEIRGLAKARFFLAAQGFERGYVSLPEVPIDLSRGGTVTAPTLALRLGPEITVSVRDPLAGAPIAGLSVGAGPAGSQSPVARTDANGLARFRYGGLEGVVSIERTPRYIEAPGSSFFRSFRLERPALIRYDVLAYRDASGPEARKATFRGQVVDKGGRPVAGATVRLLRYGEAKTATTDRDGRYAIESVRIEAYEEDAKWGVRPGTGGAVAIVAKDGVEVTHRVRAADAWTTPKIVLSAGERVSAVGRLVDETGRPLDRAGITMWVSYATDGTSLQPQNAGMTDAQGRFEVKNLDPGASYLFAMGGRDAKGSLGTTHVPPQGQGFVALRRGQRHDFGTIVVPRADVVVAGKVLDRKGGPVATEILVTLDGAHTSTSATPDARGRFEFKDVVREPLTLRVFASKDGFTRTGEESPDRLLTLAVRAGDRAVRAVVTPRAPQP